MKTEHTPLDTNQKELLRLIDRSPQDAKGWAVCSDSIWPMTKAVPKELLERQPSIWGGMKINNRRNGNRKIHMKRAQRGISRAIPALLQRDSKDSEPKSSFGDSLTVRTNGYEDAQIETRISESIKRSIARQVLAELVKPQQNTTT